MSLVLCRLAAVCAVAVVLIARPVVAAEGRSTTRRSPVTDVALGPGGLLQGVLVNDQGLPRSGETVVLHGTDQQWQVRTDRQGAFAVRGLSGGVYQITFGDCCSVHRCWVVGTAPPGAMNRVLYVTGRSTVRGQFLNPTARQWLVENGGHLAIISAFIALPIYAAIEGDAS